MNSTSSISELFDGDHEKVKKLNKMVCDKMGFTKWQQVSGQTYTRKLDYMVLSALSGLAQSAYKMCGDIRLLASMKEIGKEYDITSYTVVVVAENEVNEFRKNIEEM